MERNAEFKEAIEDNFIEKSKEPKYNFLKNYAKKWENEYKREASEGDWINKGGFIKSNNAGTSFRYGNNSMGGSSSSFSSNKIFMSGKNEGNLLAPLVDSLYDTAKLIPSAIDSLLDMSLVIGKGVFKLASNALDCYGDIIYRIVEGKPYIEQIEGENSNNEEITIENIQGKYKFHAINEFKEFKLEDKISYVAIEGEKEGLKAYVGIDTEGEYYPLDILRGHLLIGACSEWGKSNLINIYMTNLIRTYTENEFRYMLCDYKAMDLMQFEGYKHCIGNCVTDKKGFLKQIDYLEKEYQRRIEYIRNKGYLSAKDFNEDKDNKEKFPYILYVIDELPTVVADSFSQKRLIELMRMCRVGGIYLILATQDARKATIDAVRMLVSQVIGLHTATKTDSDTLIEEANLHEIDVKGRFKIKVAGEIKEVQSFYLKAKEIKEVLKNFKVNSD